MLTIIVKVYYLPIGDDEKVSVHVERYHWVYGSVLPT